MSHPHPTPSTTAVQAVIFDLDGVLINSEWLGLKVWREQAERCGGTLSEAIYSEIVGTSVEESALCVMRHAGVTFDLAEGTAWYWRRMIERLKTEIEPLPGAVELVRALAARGCALAIASNAPSDYIQSALTGLGLLDLFPVRVGVDQVAQGKPAPDVYLSAARRLGIPPRHCLAVEDSRPGAQAAVEAGLRVIAVPDASDRPDEFQNAWRVYPSLMQVRQELDTLLQ